LSDETPASTGKTQPGRVSRLEILEIQPEGKRVMTMAEWMAGRRDLAGREPRFTSEPA
jgi:hypothetical protein